MASCESADQLVSHALRLAFRPDAWIRPSGDPNCNEIESRVLDEVEARVPHSKVSCQRSQGIRFMDGRTVIGQRGLWHMLCGLVPACASCGPSDAVSGQMTKLTTVEAEGSMEVQVYELWQRELDDSVDFAGGIAVWEDGTIWLGSQDTHLWEMNAQGELLRAVTASREASNRGRALALSSTPDRQGAVLVSSNGTTIYPGRRAEGGYTEAHRRSVAGIATFEGGDYVLSYTPYSDDGHAGYAVHRYSLGGDLLARWHPVYSDDDWQVTSWMSGGPVAVTRAGDLLFSPRVPPFLVVRYPGGYPDAAAVLVEDETIVSREELRRALARRRTVQWKPSGFRRRAARRKHPYGRALLPKKTTFTAGTLGGRVARRRYPDKDQIPGGLPEDHARRDRQHVSRICSPQPQPGSPYSSVC